MELEVRIELDLSGYGKYVAEISKHLTHGTGPIRKVHQQWGARFRSFTQIRFNKYSRGGGDWPSLKNTRSRNRKGQFLKQSILRDTNTLFYSVTPAFSGLPGQLQRGIPLGIEVGIGGASKHPKGLRTVGEIATYHQTGAGNNPVRKIIVLPPQDVINSMSRDLKRGCDTIANKHDK